MKTTIGILCVTCLVSMGCASPVWGPVFVYQRPIDAMVDVTNDLGIAVLQDHVTSRGNFAFSPYGVASVLVLLYEGARGESARQIHNTMRFPWQRDVTRIGFRDIHRHLRTYFSHEGYLSGITLSKVNTSLLPEYQRVLRFYGYDVSLGNTMKQKPTTTMTTPTSNTTAANETTTTDMSTNTTDTTVMTTSMENEATTMMETTTDMGANTTDTTVMTTTMENETTTMMETTTDISANTTDTTIMTTTMENTTATMMETTTDMGANATETTVMTTIMENETTTMMETTTDMGANATETTVMTTIMENETTTMMETTTDISANTTDTTVITTSMDNATTTIMETTTDMTTNTTDTTVMTTSTDNATTTIMETTTVMSTNTTDTTVMTTSMDTTTDMGANTTEATMMTTKMAEVGDTGDTSETRDTTQSTPTYTETTAHTEAEMRMTPDSMDAEAVTVLSTVATPDNSPGTESTSEPPEEPTEFDAETSTEGTTLGVVSTATPADGKDNPKRQNDKRKPVLKGLNVTQATDGVESRIDEVEGGAQMTLTTEDGGEVSAPPTETEATALTTTEEEDTTTVPAEEVDAPQSASFKVETFVDAATANSSEAEAVRREKRVVKDPATLGYPDISLQLQNGMYGSHVSRGDSSLLAQLPRHPFLVDGATDELVPVMSYTAVFPFAFIPRLHSVALEFPLDDERYKLLIILPVERRGLKQLIYDMSSCPLRDVYESLQPTRVNAVIPSFMVEGFVILTSTLQQLGIWDVFDPRRSDLSGMSSDPELFVRNIEQSITVVIRNYVEIVDIQTRTMAARSKTERFEATHPFLYFVMDTETHVALMAGKIIDPLNSRIY